MEKLTKIQQKSPEQNNKRHKRSKHSQFLPQETRKKTNTKKAAVNATF